MRTWSTSCRWVRTKIDLDVVHPLTREDFAAFEAGKLDLGVLARNLAEHDQTWGTFERRD